MDRAKSLVMLETKKKKAAMIIFAAILSICIQVSWRTCLLSAQATLPSRVFLLNLCLRV